MKKKIVHVNFRVFLWMWNEESKNMQHFTIRVKLLVPELFFFILAYSVYKMWIIQEPNTLALWKKLHFEKEKMESLYHV